MNGNKLSTKDYQIFLYKTFIILSLAWSGFALALAGFFYAEIAWGFSIFLGILMFFIAKKHRVITKISREMFLVSFISIIIAAIFAFNSTPTIFSGRDQGAISEAAIRLSQNHSLHFSLPASEEFFKLHEKGRALNFPGFYYFENGSLITQFPLAYIVWLSLFFSIFGLTGLALANTVLLSLFLISFYLLIRLFLETSKALPIMLFTISSFIFMWFSKFTLSENMALPLLWFSILCLMLFIQYQRKLFFINLLASLFLLCFTRIEGYAFLFSAFIVILSHRDTREYFKKDIFKNILLPLIIFVGLFAINFVIDINFFREIAKAILPSVKLPQAEYLGNLKNTALPQYYTLKLFFLYGMIGFFILSFLATVKFICTKQFYKLIPFFIILPTTLYLFDSNISPDHPWMLRRHMTSLMPAAILYAGLLIGEFMDEKSKSGTGLKYAAIILSILLVWQNIPAFSYFFNSIENKGLLEQTKQISQQFTNKDLVLVDQKTTSDGWSMIAGPMSSLFGKNSAYFFNNQDLAKLDLTRFENVYLISPNEQVPFYLNSTIGKRLNENGAYEFNFEKLDSKKTEYFDEVNFPVKKDIEVKGKIFKVSK